MGVTPQPALPEDQPNAWFDGRWQATVEHRVNRDFALRPALIRFINQVRYSLFDEHTPVITKGQNGYLFETAHRAPLCGQDLISQDSVMRLIRSLDDFRNRLLRKGKRLVIMIAPNKWRTLAKQVDCDCKPKWTNYQRIVPELQARGYAVFDAIDAFQYEQAAKPVHPLHSKQGTHWSHFGAAISADYLRYTFSQEGIQLPAVSFDSVEVVNQPRSTDKDLQELLNIMVEPEAEKLAYPILSFSGDYKPRVTVIGDSYYRIYYLLGLHQGLFAMESKYFYYNRSLIDTDVYLHQPLNDSIRRTEIEASDAVLLVLSEPLLSELGFGIQSLEF